MSDLWELGSHRRGSYGRRWRAANNGQPPAGGSTASAGSGGAAALRPNRYYDRVILDAARVCRDVGRIAEQVIAHLAGLIGAKATVTLEVEAAVPGGVQEHVVQNVTEKGWTLHEPGL